MRFQLRPSRALAAAIVAAHAAAALSLLLLVKGLAGAALAALLLALGFAAARRRALLRGRGAVRALEVSGDALRLELGGGSLVPVAVAKRRYVGRWLVALPLGAARGYRGRTVLVSADMLEASEFRRLRVWALWGRLPGVAAGQLAA
ncbi:MAG TPA: protein YgfX [Burkholderiales bacterium]